MKSLLVSYDLNRAGQDYDDVWAYLRRQTNWWHHLDSTWVVRTEKSAKEIRDELREVGLDGNDKVLIVELEGTAAWAGLNDRAADWLRKNL